jgi:adenosylcobinamide-phosphate synthase
VLQPLAAGDLVSARATVARLVSRDPEAMDEHAIARATTESVLENGADAVFASLFWFLLAGLPGLVAHRLINTLDAMWGYRTPRFERFGKAAARLDDVLGWVPARLTAFTYALVGNWQRARQCWRYQARHWSSPNAGVVMAAGAGALGVTLGGDAVYADGVHQRPRLGGGGAPDAGSIRDALSLVQRALVLWLALIVLGGLLS